jgi:hypothetical protein
VTVERGAGTGEKIQIDPSFHRCLFTTSPGLGATADGQGCAKECSQGASELSGRRVVGIILGKGVLEEHLVLKWLCRVR